MIFQTINSVRSCIRSLKYDRITPSGCKDIGIKKSEFVEKTQFLCIVNIRAGRSTYFFICNLEGQLANLVTSIFNPLVGSDFFFARVQFLCGHFHKIKVASIRPKKKILQNMSIRVSKDAS